MTEHPLTQRGLDYAAAAAAGDVPAGRLAGLACERARRDHSAAETDPDYPYRFDPAAAEHMLAFIEEMPHVEGALAGQKIRLDPWQAFALGQIGGWLQKSDGLRRFRTAYIEVPRKNGKSTLLAALGLYFLIADGEAGAKVYSAAASSDQARIVFNLSRAMALRAEFDDGRTRRGLADALGLQIGAHTIRTDDPTAVFAPIAAQTKASDGKNPHLAIVDELHQHQNRDVWESMATALGAREQPLLISITTAGQNVAGVCYEQNRYVAAVLEGTRRDDSYFGVIYNADEDDDPSAEMTWRKANPSLGSAKKLEYMRREWNRAQANPVEMGDFLRKHLDVWTSVGVAALDVAAWRRNADPTLRREDFAGAGGVIGVDLSIKDDVTAVVALIPREGGGFVCFGRYFLPETTVNLPHNDHLQGFARQGLLTVNEGSRIDYGLVQDAIQRDAEHFGAEAILFDPAFAANMMASLSELGHTVAEFRQTPLNMTAPFQHVIAEVADGLIAHDGDPVLHWMAANTYAKQSGDFIRPAKPTGLEEFKIDGISALVTARGYFDAPAARSYLEEEGMVVL